MIVPLESDIVANLAGRYKMFSPPVLGKMLAACNTLC
jgi:hypothetical protein